MADKHQANGRAFDGFLKEFAECWRRIPDKTVFFSLLAGWVALFHYYGHGIMSYVQTDSMFVWLRHTYAYYPDDEHGLLIPFVVVGLLWWKRQELLDLPKRVWWPGLLLLTLVLLMHLVGYMVQQTRISIVAFIAGVYVLMALTWGPRMFVASFFPMCLLAFSVPIQSVVEPLTFRLRLLATNITTLLSNGVLNFGVIQDGTRLFDPQGAYQYEIAGACSGIRSLTATLAIAVIYAFVALKSPGRRAVLIAAAFPLAVLANVFRLMMIIVAAEGFGQQAGNFVHDSNWTSLLPYVPAIFGILVVGHFLRERKSASAPAAPGSAAGMEGQP